MFNDQSTIRANGMATGQHIESSELELPLLLMLC